jgi:hypothetical protein
MRAYTFTPDNGDQAITITAVNKVAFYVQLGKTLDRNGQAIRVSSVGPDVWDGDTYLGHVTSVNVREIWTVSTKRGPRYYYYAQRVFPMRKLEALAMIANGTAVLVERPEFLGPRK